MTSAQPRPPSGLSERARASQALRSAMSRVGGAPSLPNQLRSSSCGVRIRAGVGRLRPAQPFPQHPPPFTREGFEDIRGLDTSPVASPLSWE